MQVALQQWSAAKGWQRQKDLPNSDLVIYFGGKGTLESGERYRELKASYPNAHIIGCSTGGEIYGGEVQDETVVASVVHFEQTKLLPTFIDFSEIEDPFAAGVKLANTLNKAELTNIFFTFRRHS